MEYETAPKTTFWRLFFLEVYEGVCGPLTQSHR